MLFGKRYYCPVCNNKHNQYQPLPQFYEDNAKAYGYQYFGTGEMTAKDTYFCSKCGASDRERLYAWYLRKTFNGNESFSFYHFAPEEGLRNFIKNYFSRIQYTTFDLLSERVDVKADLTNLNMIEDNECDFFLCSHVLEHIEEDTKAIGELYRITKPGGKGILMAPISLAITTSIENVPDVKTDADCWRYYGQNDHVRVYAKGDFVNRILASGFKLHQYDLNYFGKRTFKELGLKDTSILYVVEKQS
ncbi:MAG TPA: methyltransferase domain-containing protein [Bacillota bacterium]|nr:methyltransferase domain-containing protein [Bacillota bacterium]